MIVENMMLYIKEDKEGFVSIVSDGYKKDSEMWVNFIAALKSRQTEDDLEMQGVMNTPHPTFREGMR